MKIKIDIRNLLLHEYETYIKSCCKYVRNVYSDSIYFENDEKDFGASWYYVCGGCEDPKIIVKQLNGLLGTEFELEE